MPGTLLGLGAETGMVTDFHKAGHCEVTQCLLSGYIFFCESLAATVLSSLNAILYILKIIHILLFIIYIFKNDKQLFPKQADSSHLPSPLCRALDCA